MLTINYLSYLFYEYTFSMYYFICPSSETQHATLSKNRYSQTSIHANFHSVQYSVRWIPTLKSRSWVMVFKLRNICLNDNGHVYQKSCKKTGIIIRSQKIFFDWRSQSKDFQAIDRWVLEKLAKIWKKRISSPISKKCSWKRRQNNTVEPIFEMQFNEKQKLEKNWDPLSDVEKKFHSESMKAKCMKISFNKKRWKSEWSIGKSQS